MYQWFTHGVLVLVSVFVVLTIANALTDSSRVAWLTVASVASVLALMVAVGPGRLR